MSETPPQLPPLKATSPLKARHGPVQNSGPKAAKAFESMFMGQFVDEMMKTVKFGSFSGGFGEDMWRSFMSNAIADQIVDHSDLGIAGNIEGMLNAYKK